MYGLLAEEMLVAPDKSSLDVAHSIRKARFYNGDPVTAADVKHSFDMLTSKLRATPRRARGWPARRRRRARRAHDPLRPQGPHHRHDLQRRQRLPVFSRKWGQGADGKPKEFDEIINEYPITSGPYTIAAADSGGGSNSSRNKNYWARDLGCRARPIQFRPDRLSLLPGQRGRDGGVQGRRVRLAAWNIRRGAGRASTRDRNGTTAGSSRQAFPNGFGAGLQSYMLNLRRPLFQDIRVREALAYAYDFEAVNVYKQYKRTNSVFANSEFAATGMPGARRARAARAVSRRAAAGSVRPGVGAAADGRGPERAAREPEEGARAARGGRLEGRTPTACCATPRASHSSSSIWSRQAAPAARRRCWQRNLGEARHQAQACVSSTSRSIASGSRRSTSTWRSIKIPTSRCPTWRS